MAKTVCLIGATGLIGGHLLQLLLQDESVEKIKIPVRRPYPSNDPKVVASQINFEDPIALKNEIAGCDLVFCCVGTTQKKVKGDAAAYRKVDFDIPANAARFCAETGCKAFVLVSSVGASAGSGNFYLKLKGEAENAAKNSGVESVLVFRPSMLLGERNEFRPAERFGQFLMKLFSFAIPSSYKPVKAKDVAAAMLRFSHKSEKGFHIYHYAEIAGG